MEDYKNKILIASPNVKGIPFEKSVIYICHHNNYGASGFIINFPIKTKFSKNLKKINLNIEKEIYKNFYEKKIFLGGPLKTNKIFILYLDEKFKNKKDKINDIKIKDNLYLKTYNNILEIIKDNFSKNTFVVIGYSSWEKNQLEEEIINGDWLVCNKDYKFIFENKSYKKLQLALSFLGIDNYNKLSKEVGYV